MATLSQATQATRNIFKWGAIAFAVFLVVRMILFPIGKAIVNTYFPKKPPAPTTAFGKLPKIPFPTPTGGQKPTNIVFTIQTTTGSLPPTCIEGVCQPNNNPTQPTTIPDRLLVYKVIQKQAGFSSYDVAKQRVQGAGFGGEGTALSPIVYRWRHPKREDRQITYNTITESFTLTTKIASASSGETTTPQPPPAGPEAVTIAKNFLASMSLLPKDIDDKATSITFLKLRNGQVVKATSLSESSLVQVDFYRKPLINMPVVYPNPQQSLLSFIIQAGGNREEGVVEGQYAYKIVDDTKSSTYPIKTAQEAFTQLQQGQAYVASLGHGSTIGIQKVYLAYYEGNDDLTYFLPIFIFEGENGFLGFVEAVSSQWVE